MVAMAREGASLREIADQFGMSPETVRRWLSQAGVSAGTFREARLARRAARRAARWQKVVDQHGDEAERLWRQRMSTPQIASALGVPLRVAAALVRERITEGERRRRRGEVCGKEVWPPEATFAALRRAATILGCTPGQKAYDRLLGEGQISGPTSGRIVQRFGWAAACREAGLEPNQRHPHRKFGAPKYSEQDMARALQRVQRELGKRPTHGTYAGHRRPDEPSAGTIRLRFGRWLQALDALLGKESETATTAGRARDATLTDQLPAAHGGGSLSLSPPLAATDLLAALERFKTELSARLGPSTNHSYLTGSALFLRWLAGDYAPDPGRGPASAPTRRSAS